MSEREYEYFSPRLNRSIPFSAIQNIDRRNRGVINLTEFQRRLRNAGFTPGQADTIYYEYLRGETQVTVPVAPPPPPPEEAYYMCDIVKYFTVKIKNVRRTPQIRFEVRAQLTIPARIVDTDNVREAKDYFDEKVEPIFDDVLSSWGNQERVGRAADGSIIRWQNVLDLGNFDAEFFNPNDPVGGIEVISRTTEFKGSAEFTIAKYKDNRPVLTQTRTRNIREDEL
jgi:hypothetical protein